MYSFAQRKDTRIVDEPLYAHYLRVTGLEHPGRAETLASQENDGQKVVREVLLADYDVPLVFFKQMAKQLIDLDMGFLQRCTNVLLIRDPRLVLASFGKVVEQPDRREVGYERLYDIWRYLVDHGQHPIVLDGTELRKNPAAVLGELCRRLEITFDPDMLRWDAGARPEDGSWAPYWYHAVHRSTGFKPYKQQEVLLPPHLQALAGEQQRYYAPLYELAIKAEELPH